MENQRVHRRLAAIVAMDIVGYSRMMGADEDGTLSRLKAIRSELLAPLMETHRGRLVKTTGDGFLIEFASVVDAFKFSSEVQIENDKRVQATPHEFAMVFRIGINVGDIIIDDGDVYGDGVNIAARLEQMSDPCGICVSDRAYRDLRNFACDFDDLGFCDLKNIDDPIRVYRARLDQQRPPRTTPPEAEAAQKAAQGKKPSAAVGKFGQPAHKLIIAGISAFAIISLCAWFLFGRSESADAKVTVGIGQFRTDSALLPKDLRAKVQVEVANQFQSEALRFVKFVPDDGLFTVTGEISLAGEKIQSSLHFNQGNEQLAVITNEYYKPDDRFVSRRLAIDINNTLSCAFDMMKFRKNYSDINLSKVAFEYCTIDSVTQNLASTKMLTKLMPNSSDAWASLGSMTLSYANAQKSPTLKKEVKGFLEKSIALDERNPTPILVMARMAEKHDYITMEKYLAKSVELDPSYCGCAFHYYASLLGRLGRIEDEARYLALAMESAPLSHGLNFQTLDNEMAKGHFDHAEIYANESRRLWTGDGFEDYLLNIAFAKRNGVLAKSRLTDQHVSNEYSPELLAAFQKVADGLAQNNKKALDAGIERVIELGSTPGNRTWLSVQLLGQFARNIEALEMLDKMVAESEENVELAYLPMLAGARREPMMVSIFKKVGLIDYWKKSGHKPDFCKTEQLPQFCS